MARISRIPRASVCSLCSFVAAFRWSNSRRMTEPRQNAETAERNNPFPLCTAIDEHARKLRGNFCAASRRERQPRQILPCRPRMRANPLALPATAVFLRFLRCLLWLFEQKATKETKRSGLNRRHAYKSQFQNQKFSALSVAL